MVTAPRGRLLAASVDIRNPGFVRVGDTRQAVYAFENLAD